MSIEKLIECIGLSPIDLKLYLLSEIDEFLEAENHRDQLEEFGDVLFALRAMAWAYSGRHYAFSNEVFESKVLQRLKKYGTLSRRSPVYLHERIADMSFDVVHFAFNQFSGPWKHFDPLKNGTVAEIHLLTDNPVGQPGVYGNHCIVTFDTNDSIEYDVISATDNTASGNTVLCRLPDFMYREARKKLTYSDLSEYMGLQVIAGLSGLTLSDNAFIHFHSWEGGFLTESAAFRKFVKPYKTLFSPYLTVARLKSLVEDVGGAWWTMSPEELQMGAEYEQKLCTFAAKVVLESERDKIFYQDWANPQHITMLTFAQKSAAYYKSDPIDDKHLTFIAGGRPVREKGFVEMCREFAFVRDWACKQGLSVSLTILCRERAVTKGADYIKEVERTIAEYDLQPVVTIEQKVSLDILKRRIAQSAAVIVPSLYDPFCLMPTYAVESERPAFISCYAGVSENVTQPAFIFDPTVQGALADAIIAWYKTMPRFKYVSRFPSYRDLYLARQKE